MCLRPAHERRSEGGRRRAQCSRRRVAPAHLHVLRHRRLDRALGSPRAGDLPRTDAGLSRREPRRDREPLRRPHRPHQGRRSALDLRLPGRARERRRAGGPRGARARASGARAAAASRLRTSRSSFAWGSITAPSTSTSTRTTSTALPQTSARGWRRFADPGTVVVSDEVRQLVEDHFDLEACEPQMVKGVAEPLVPFRVVGERLVSPSPIPQRRSSSARTSSSGSGEAWAPVAAGDTERASGHLDPR